MPPGPIRRALAAARTPVVQRRLIAAFLLAAACFAALALASQWDDAGDRLASLSVGQVGAAAAWSVAALVASLFAWRETLAGFGSRLPRRVAARVYFLGQLAKYVPGSVWSIVGQMELAKVYGVRRDRTATAGVVVLVISLGTALGLGVLALPALLDAGGTGYAAVVLVLVPLVVALHPRVLTWLVETALRLLRRPPLEVSLTGAVIGRVALLALVNNVLLGLQVWHLTMDLGGDPWRSLPLAIGGFGIASAAGLLAVPLPAGAGLREAVLVLVLAPEVGVAGATLVAIIGRLLLTVADVGAAGVAAATTRTPRSEVPGATTGGP